MTRRREAPVRVTALVTVLVSLMALTTCGVPRNDEARPIAEQELFEGAPPTTPGESADQRVILYFVRDEKLVEAPRPAETASDVGAVIRTLLGGLTPREEALNLVSSIPPDTRLLNEPNLKARVLTVDLSAEMSGITGDTFKQACAQIVFTATEVSGVGQVAFRIEGKAIAVPTDEGNLDRVNRSDYAELDPAEQ